MTITASTTSTPNLTTSIRQNRDSGIKVQFHGVNTGQTTAGKASKWTAVGVPQVQVPKGDGN